jgi:hypothetical protein
MLNLVLCSCQDGCQEKNGNGIVYQYGSFESGLDPS